MRAKMLAGLALAVVMVVGSAGAAGAVSHLDPEDEIPTLSFFFDPVLATLYFDTHEPGAEGELADCSAEPAPDDCLAVEVRQPANHGAVVSSFVHALEENPDLWSGPRGHLVRQLARSDAGKQPEALDEPVELDGVELEPDERPSQPRMDRPGPPPHAPAHGFRDR